MGMGFERVWLGVLVLWGIHTVKWSKTSPAPVLAQTGTLHAVKVRTGGDRRKPPPRSM